MTRQAAIRQDGSSTMGELIDETAFDKWEQSLGIDVVRGID